MNPYNYKKYLNNNTGVSYQYGYPVVGAPQQWNPVMAQPPIYLSNSPGLGSTIVPFSGELMNHNESIYEFLEQIRYSQTFKACITDEKKIEVVGSYLCDRAREWFSRQDWTSKKYGSETEEGSFVYEFLDHFLSDIALYNLKSTYNHRQQLPTEDAIAYVKEKVRLFKRFSKVTTEKESMLAAVIVQGLNFDSQKGLKSLPVSVNDLEAQLQQADWIKRQELKRDLAVKLGGNSYLSSPGSVPSNSGGVYGQPYLNQSNSHAFPHLNAGYQPYSGMVTQVSDVDSMNATQLMYLQHQLNSSNQVVLPSAINHTAATISTDNQGIIRALSDKIEKLAADLEKTKINELLVLVLLQILIKPRMTIPVVIVEKMVMFNATVNNLTGLFSQRTSPVGIDVPNILNPTTVLNVSTDKDEDVLMLSTEEWEAQKRARRLQQLAMARQKKRELAALDKIAIAAKKTHPLMVDDKGKLLQGFNAKQYFKNQMVQIPLVELLALSSEYNQQTKEALGFSSKNAKTSASSTETGTSISNNISTLHKAGTCPLTIVGNVTNPEAKASQVLSDPIREVYNTDV
ncbi:hypothetical protein BD770DRAFT_416883, partial [Pilaira anomala]